MHKASYRCPKCGRTFALPLHLGRHMAATHGATKAKARKAPARRKKRRVQRERRAGTLLGLGQMALHQLAEVLASVTREAPRARKPRKRRTTR